MFFSVVYPQSTQGCVDTSIFECPRPKRVPDGTRLGTRCSTYPVSPGPQSFRVWDTSFSRVRPTLCLSFHGALLVTDVSPPQSSFGPRPPTLCVGRVKSRGGDWTGVSAFSLTPTRLLREHVFVVLRTPSTSPLTVCSHATPKMGPRYLSPTFPETSSCLSPSDRSGLVIPP